MINNKIILDAIDMDEWQQSWHLPKNHWGAIDFTDPETVERCKRILIDKTVQREKEIRMINAALNELTKRDVMG